MNPNGEMREKKQRVGDLENHLWRPPQSTASAYESKIVGYWRVITQVKERKVKTLRKESKTSLLNTYPSFPRRSLTYKTISGIIGIIGIIRNNWNKYCPS